MENSEVAVELERINDNGISKEAKTILTDAIYRIKNIGKYISELFTRGVTLNIAPEKECTVSKESVQAYFKEIRAREKEKGNPEMALDNDIHGWFNGAVIPAIVEAFTSTIQRFKKTLTHQQILDEAEKLSVKKIYTWLEALSIIKAAIMAGEVDIKGLGVIVYFKVEGNDTLYRFIAVRGVDSQLLVDVFEVYFGNEWYAGDGASFS